ncbi:MAG: Wzz/FepE/Etk N-terminal domain-containing protein [Staphylococcus epidermidis]|nr:Wzz/FepE/Etk N-terminal domain-containing protein [Staphylococcus epidermidis]
MNSEGNNIIDELSNIFNILKKHMKMIVFTTIIMVMIAFIGVFYVVKPKYQSTAEIIVNQKLDKDAQASELQQVQSTDLQLVNTYKSILNSQTIGNAVEQSIGGRDYRKTSLTVDTDTTSQVISLNVTANSPSLAAKTANKTAEIFKKKINKIMNVNNVSIISKATENKKPTSPKKMLILIGSIIVGIIIGSFFALFKEYNDKTIEDEDYITNDLGLIDLGTIGDIDIKQIKKDTKH